MSRHEKKTPQPAAPRSTTTPPAAPKPARKPKSPAQPSKVIFSKLVAGALKTLNRAGDMRPPAGLAEHMDKITGALEFVTEEARGIPEDWVRGKKARVLTAEQRVKLQEQAAKLAKQAKEIAERLAMAGAVEIDPRQATLPAVDAVATA